MDAVKYLKEKARLTKRCAIHCDSCRLGGRNVEERLLLCKALQPEAVEQAVAIIEQWAKDCPEETYRTKFLKAFPKANLVDNMLCVKTYYGGDAASSCPEITCTQCWDQPYKEENDGH